MVVSKILAGRTSHLYDTAVILLCLQLVTFAEKCSTTKCQALLHFAMFGCPCAIRRADEGNGHMPFVKPRRRHCYSCSKALAGRVTSPPFTTCHFSGKMLHHQNTVLYLSSSFRHVQQFQRDPRPAGKFQLISVHYVIVRKYDYDVLPKFNCISRFLDRQMPIASHYVIVRKYNYMYDVFPRACTSVAIIIYIRKSQQTEVFLLGALNDYEDA